MPATFYEQDIKAGLKNKRKLSAFIDGQMMQYAQNVKKAQLTYIFCTDDFLLGINRQYLAHDTLTDIITFDLSENKETLIGEIYVSIERVKENAALYNTTYARELHRVIFHGALHLCGFKDKKKSDRETMRKQENEWMEKYYQFLTFDF